MRTNKLVSRRFRVVALLLALAMCLAPVASLAAPAAADSAWGSGTLTDDQIMSLISQMTLAEEISFVHGANDNTCSSANVSDWVQGCVGQAGYIPGVARLGIPPLRPAESGAGGWGPDE